MKIALGRTKNTNAAAYGWDSEQALDPGIKGKTASKKAKPNPIEIATL
jgi:hypothetical protein